MSIAESTYGSVPTQAWDEDLGETSHNAETR